MNYIFDGSVKEGKLLLDKGPKFREYLSTLNGRRVQVTVEKFRQIRSNPQNRYFHGVTCKVIADATGTDLEVVKAFLKQNFGAKVFFGNKWVPKPTHLMDPLEMAQLCDGSRLWAAEFLNCQIPLPGEVTA
jgi:hypothetical protein